MPAHRISLFILVLAVFVGGWRASEYHLLAASSNADHYARLRTRVYEMYPRDLQGRLRLLFEPPATRVDFSETDFRDERMERSLAGVVYFSKAEFYLRQSETDEDGAYTSHLFARRGKVFYWRSDTNRGQVMKCSEVDPFHLAIYYLDPASFMAEQYFDFKESPKKFRLLKHGGISTISTSFQLDKAAVTIALDFSDAPLWFHGGEMRVDDRRRVVKYSLPKRCESRKEWAIPEGIRFTESPEGVQGLMLFP